MSYSYKATLDILTQGSQQKKSMKISKEGKSETKTVNEEARKKITFSKVFILHIN